MEKALNQCHLKLAGIEEYLLSKRHYRWQDGEQLQDGCIIRVLEPSAQVINFYQERSGRLIFLHPLCDKILRKHAAKLPNELSGEIMYVDEAEYGFDLARRYKTINHLTPSQQIDLVIIDIKAALPEEAHQDFEQHLA